MNEIMPLHERCSIVANSNILKEKLQLMIDDTKLLFPLTGSKYHFKTRCNKTQIKIQISCSHSQSFTKSTSVSSNSG